ncbi:MAG: glycosyltransferase [Candidatus Alcyoniella australis]|nr:glycosyltransferase [Candidatus Alcyoniella australis]
MDVSILVPVHNDQQHLEASLAATLGQQTRLSFEVIAIDDGSIDDCPQILQRIAATEPQLQVISKQAGGEAGALNAGLEQARGKLVAILEADVEAEPDWLEATAAALDDPQVIGAGGVLLTPRKDSWIARIAGYEVEYRQDQVQRFVPHITSANALYRREAFQIVGRFNEQLVNSCLDVDFNQRLTAAGYKLAFVRQARVRHHYKGSFLDYLKRQYAYARFRPFLRNLHLYKRDVWISLQLVLTLATLAALVLAWITPWPFVGLLIATLLSSVPPAIRVFAKHRDPVLLVFPLVMPARNVAGLLGLARGYWARWWSSD